MTSNFLPKRSTRVCIRNDAKQIVSCKRSQVTLFIVIAIILVASVAVFILLKGGTGGGMSAQFLPIEKYFTDCANNELEIGKEILGERAGWITLPVFEAGSSYAPFSNMFDFNGNAVPYWLYVSSDGVMKEQVPSKTAMERQLADYLKENLNCDFSDFEAQGFEINLTLASISVKINSGSIDADISADLVAAKDSESARQTEHKINLETNLGRMYEEAVKIYTEEKQKAFLEDYAVDALRLYAPVDGVEISCAPKTWIPKQVVTGIDNALEANINAIRTKGNYYSNVNNYFIQNIQTQDSVNFMYNQNWPRRIEIWPVESGIMAAEPVGNQEGLGILGFCYVPYHFVYDAYFPVFIQVYDSKERFQFPVSVIIDKNMPRKALEGEAVIRDFELCKYKNTDVQVNIYDARINPVDADISYKCFDIECDIGRTENGVLSEKFPQCINGFIIARAPDYSETKYQISTNSETSADVIMKKLYNVSINLEVGGKEAETAIINFKGEDYSASAVWPEQKQIQLVESSYNVTVYSYRNSSLIFPESSQRKCIETVKPGFFGLFGGTQEQCFDINLPEQQITSVLSGGGRGQDYLTEDRLERGKLKIDAESLPVPSSLDELQKNYDLFETKHLVISDE